MMRKFVFVPLLGLIVLLAACSMKPAPAVQNSPDVVQTASPPSPVATLVTVSQKGTTVDVDTRDKHILVKAGIQAVDWNFSGLALKDAHIHFDNSGIPDATCSSGSTGWACHAASFPAPPTGCDLYLVKYTVSVTTTDDRTGQEDPDIIIQK